MMQRSYRFATFYELDLMDLKILGRFRQKSIKHRTRLKILPPSYLDQVFPELQYFFKSGLYQKSAYALPSKAHRPKNIASMHMIHISHLLKTSSHGHYDKETARQLRFLARKSIGNSDSTVFIQITQTISQIELLDSRIDKVETEMTEIMRFNDPVIMTIPGIEHVNGGMILREIGDIHRFSKPPSAAYIHRFGSFRQAIRKTSRQSHQDI